MQCATYQNPEGPKYGPRSFFWIAKGPIETTKTTRAHPRTSVNHLLRAVTRIRMNRRKKACSASANDLENKQVNGHVIVEARFSPDSRTDVSGLLDTAWNRVTSGREVARADAPCTLHRVSGKTPRRDTHRVLKMVPMDCKRLDTIKEPKMSGMWVQSPRREGGWITLI